jgi:hypothetical protein
MEPKEYQSYKPSKSFLVRGGIATGVILLILIFQTNWFTNLFNKKPKLQITQNTNETIGGLVAKDTNGNGIPDWEEKLWGLDPAVLYTNGVSNKQIIEQKKKDLGIVDSDKKPENETDLLAKQLFSITTAAGSGSQNTDFRAIGTDLGKSIKLKQVTNRYSLKDIKTTKTDTASLQNYYKSISKVTSQYKNETDGIDIIVSALETGDYSLLPKLKETGIIYTKLSKELQSITVPIGVSDYHLALINGFYGIAQSFNYIIEIEDNGVNALAGIAIYKTYSEKIDQASIDLNDYFIDYGIIKQ